jgi:hypothetical protein
VQLGGGQARRAQPRGHRCRQGRGSGWVPSAAGGARCPPRAGPATATRGGLPPPARQRQRQRQRRHVAQPGCAPPSPDPLPPPGRCRPGAQRRRLVRPKEHPGQLCGAGPHAHAAGGAHHQQAGVAEGLGGDAPAQEGGRALGRGRGRGGSPAAPGLRPVASRLRPCSRTCLRSTCLAAGESSVAARPLPSC